MNSVNLIGRITKDPELRSSSNGKSFVAFTLAVNEFSGGNQFTQFVPCFAWEKTAENLAKFVKKGAQISVEGSINVRQENNNGQFSQIVTVRANRIEFLNGTGSNNQSGSNNSFESNQSKPTAQPSSNNFDFDLIDDSKSSNDDSILWED
ncbi:single-stranded DNA-binding protein [Spiroplasma cantharicola]|uniref:Single-stranded DNA-binding protein n=1 Tax=Spiroplasma cantharicola TaxID=362837 RepID=A0A0M4KDR2_9MOLU|nr:single-stranded DNA-binding protein [Spiroplasma cantharicola]ALD65932.1 single-strand DNA-binding protein [Spiroplasma cantharicola]